MKMALAAVCCVALAWSAVGCAGAVESEAQSTEDSELSASRVQVLGAIDFGDTKLASYTSSPKYRAYSLKAKAGDHVDLWVRSTNGDAVAYLLDASFATKITNSDANATTRDAHIEATIPADGTYYVAFRNRAAAAADFSILLDWSSPALPPGTSTNDPFDPASCSGAPMTLAEFVSHFTAGAHSTELGAYTMMTRNRVCDPVTGCSAWSKTVPTGNTGIDGVPELAGTAHLVVGSATTVSLLLADASYPGSLRADAVANAGPLSFVIGSSSPYLYGDPRYIKGIGRGWQVNATAHCARFSHTERPHHPADAEDTEREYATLLRF